MSAIESVLNENRVFPPPGEFVKQVWAGASRDRNHVHGILKRLTSPTTRLTRAVVSRFIVDLHIGLLGFFLLSAFSLGLALAKISLVMRVTG